MCKGNKIDREDREIPTHVGEDFAARHNMYFLETSAKEAENVERLFMQIAEDLMEVYYKKRIFNKIQVNLFSKQQAQSKELPRYDTSLTQINGRTSTVKDSSCCGKLS